MFADRLDAARQLAQRLQHLRGEHPLVLGIPRGAVPMARLIADALGGELDVVLVRKLGAPGNPEFGIGAVEESGWHFLGPHAQESGATERYIERERDAQLETIRRRRAQYTRQRARIDPAGRTVVIVDDGLATGATMIAAIHALRSQQAGRIVCAVPVAPPSTLAEVARLADETVCLEAPERFHAVGQFYADFRQVEDAEVIAALAQ